MERDYIPAVHFQYMNDDGKVARELFNSGDKFIASIVPNLLDKSMKTEEGEDIYNRIHSMNNYYPDWAKEIFRENKDNPNIIWAQEGYRHCCGRCYNNLQENNGKGIDPYHEHICLDGHAQSLEKQMDVIRKGKNLIIEELGIKPRLYGPPNHLYNKDTIKAASENDFTGFLLRNGFDYFIPNFIELPAYKDDLGKDNCMIFLPETKKGKSPVIITYYDRICNGEVQNWKELFKNSYYLGIPLIKNKPKFKIWLNDKLILTAKKIRDRKR